ncbi:protein of unknown function [Streptomyces murinus]
MSFAEVQREVLQLSPARPGSVLDVGAGSGRDRGGRMILSLCGTARCRRGCPGPTWASKPASEGTYLRARRGPLAAGPVTDRGWG